MKMTMGIDKIDFDDGSELEFLPRYKKKIQEIEDFEIGFSILENRWYQSYPEKFWEMLVYRGMSEEEDEKVKYFNQKLIEIHHSAQTQPLELQQRYFDMMEKVYRIEWFECKDSGLLEFMDLDRAIDIKSKIIDIYLNSLREF